MPSILAEVAFVSNPADEQKLSTAEGQEAVADALYRGIARYLSTAKREQSGGQRGRAARGIEPIYRHGLVLAHQFALHLLEHLLVAGAALAHFFGVLLEDGAHFVVDAVFQANSSSSAECTVCSVAGSSCVSMNSPLSSCLVTSRAM